MLESLLQEHGIVGDVIKKLEGYDSQNYLVIDKTGSKYVLKVYHNTNDIQLIQEEQAYIDLISKHSSLELPTSAEISAKNFVINEKTFSRLIPFLEGTFLAEAKHNDALLSSFGKKVAELHNIDIPHNFFAIKSQDHSWDLKNALDCRSKVKFINDPHKRSWVNFFLDKFEKEVKPYKNDLQKGIIHSDLNDWNVLCENHNIKGLIDFGDMCYSWLINDIAIALSYVMFKKEDPITVATPFLKAYSNLRPLSEKEIELLYYLIPARLCVSVAHSAEKKFNEKNTNYTSISESDAWNLLEHWIKLNPLSCQNSFLKACGYQMKVPNKKDDIIYKRKFYAAESLSLSYDEPIYMDSSAFQYMHAKTGETYLDAYNNIPHVGHAHPKVASAGAKQLAKLNTNTRYLYDLYIEYSEALLSRFNGSLNKLMLVNSGSAASDLAIRIAKIVTGRSLQLVLGSGYHGNTQSTIEISHYKFNGKGGQGIQNNVVVLDLPKTYNSHYDNGEAYANDAIKKIDTLIDSGNKPAFLIAEAISGCGGQVPVPPVYLKMLSKYLRSKGILLIIDEVQTGFGRIGQHFWAHEMSDIVPDIVILGKPMGNGHPMGGVVTTAEISSSFNNGMEFFSSFGGNPVSCAIGLAVLQTIEDEELQANALNTGQYFMDRFIDLQKLYPCIGDVRGFGLFIGVELIDPINQIEDTMLAHYLKNGMRQRHILTSTDGPKNNVIKIKPPLCFNKSNVDQYIENFEALLKTKF